MKLCYVDDGDAYFTELPLAGEGSVWGDDWNDAPYEHNAGTPYNWSLKLKYDDGDSWFEEPKSNHFNSPFSVEDINAGRTPWLWNNSTKDPLYAGATPQEFKDYIRRNGGVVYVEEV